MKKILNYLCKISFCMASVVATVAVNTTCCNKLYQEKLSDELNGLRKNA